MLFFFFFNDTATTEIYTLSLHDALPILIQGTGAAVFPLSFAIIRDEFPPERVGVGIGTMSSVFGVGGGVGLLMRDRKSTRLNSSHANISYAVFCLKKKKYEAGAGRHAGE